MEGLRMEGSLSIADLQLASLMKSNGTLVDEKGEIKNCRLQKEVLRWAAA